MNNSGENSTIINAQNQQTSTQNGSVKLFRGGVEALKKINNPGFDLTSLVEKVPGFLDEPDKFIFRVRAQMSWFRSVYPLGYVITEIVTNTEVEVLVKASVYAGEGQFLQSAYGSANVVRDSAGGFPLVETAESRAIARALDYAGFGCQLDIKTYEENSGKEESDSGRSIEEKLKSHEEPSPEPEKIDGRLKVPANDDAVNSGFDKSKNVRKQNENGLDIPMDSQRIDTVAKSTGNFELHPCGQEAAVSTQDNLNERQRISATDTAKTDDETKSAPQDINRPCENTPDADKSADQKSIAKDSSDTMTDADGTQKSLSSSESQVHTVPTSSIVMVHEGKTADEIVAEYVALTSEDICTAFDPRFFNKNNKSKTGAQNVNEDGSVNPDALYINASGVETRIKNKDLQHALEYMKAHSEIQNQILFPGVPTSPLKGKTFGEVLDTERGQENILSCSRKYMKENVPAYAAALLVGESINNPSMQSAKAEQTEGNVA